jgi:HTH-type transcriptional regulator/antitoxin HipB
MALSTTARTATQLGAALRLRRRQLRLSQGDVGARTHVRQATLSLLENGATDARLSTLMDVLAALDLELVVRPREKGSDQSLGAIF